MVNKPGRIILILFVYLSLLIFTACNTGSGGSDTNGGETESRWGKAVWGVDKWNP